ncbi:hypothetical protein J4E08_06105 [Sagittula sp. NFXS13]|uniref:Uncharacterized protein n=1 Tax=Sagittula marina TaxID=943940 RepID=A0A7W6DK46_9RHOB|nr:hypothetical protein [Sagittula marina]MBB3984039.1 hypothetical protein [Sagittula marina]
MTNRHKTEASLIAHALSLVYDELGKRPQDQAFMSSAQGRQILLVLERMSQTSAARDQRLAEDADGMARAVPEAIAHASPIGPAILDAVRAWRR